jgi:hypothetical protein
MVRKDKKKSVLDIDYKDLGIKEARITFEFLFKGITVVL